jgi:glycosyltransferase involved in cell wall biosynthesis
MTAAVSPSLQEAPHSNEIASLRVLIVHEWLVSWAGSERVLEQLVALAPHADVVVAVATPDMRRSHAIAERARETWLSKIPGARLRHRWFLPLHPFAFGSIDTSKYDLVISSSHAFAKSVRVRERTAHVCYCHSPPRYLWDLAETYAAAAPFTERLALRAATPLLRHLDRRSAAGVSTFVSNSKFVADRIRRCYARESVVVAPPVVAKAQSERRPTVSGRGDFLLSLGRLVSYKRVDLAIAAAERLGVPIVVAGSGPEQARLERMAGPNTSFVGEVTEAEAAELMERCRAFVFCGEEDFGIAPVEANAHGAPVIGLGRGGLLESMVDGETAELFAEARVDDVSAAIERALARGWDETVVRANAARFAPEVFRTKMRDVLEQAATNSR